MSGQGYHLAIQPEKVDAILRDDPELMGLQELLEQMGDSTPEFVHDYYKEWDVLHRCLSDGTFNPKGGHYPLNQCFICARLLCTEGEIINLVEAGAVPDVANALHDLSKEEFEARFVALYGGEFTGRTMKRYVEEYYAKVIALGEFYRKAADAGRAIVFFTDDPLSCFE